MANEPTLRSRFIKAWNVFRNRNAIVLDAAPYAGELSDGKGYPIGPVGTSFRPDVQRMSWKNSDTTIASVFTTIANDCARPIFQHVRVDEQDNYQETIHSGLNDALNYEANIDQTGRAFIYDLVLTMLDQGCVAALPIDTKQNPQNGSFDIISIRVAKILDWYPAYVRLEAYNDRSGNREQVVVPKRMVAIIENPFYSVMNAPNSELQRLNHKLRLLDTADDRAYSGKIDLLIQLPYVVKGKTREDQAEKRRKQVEEQLMDSAYGIAYIDGTERVTQLNRPAENNLLEQIKYLTSMLYSQLGITPEILAGTAEESVMLNYQTRTIDVILNAIVDEFERKFLTKTAKTQGQAIRFYRNPFALASTDSIAEVADKFTRNEILSSNEVRSIIGFKPSKDPTANELRNKNLNRADNEKPGETYVQDDVETSGNRTIREEITNKLEEGDPNNG